MAGRKRKSSTPKEAKNYLHTESESPMRPDVGTQAQFKKKKPPVTYRYDSSLSPALDWDGQNHAREKGEELIRKVLEAPSLEKAKEAAAELKALSRPFLNWAGKAERLSFDVPTLPLFVHERLSTKAILETLKQHRKDAGSVQMDMFSLFGDPQHSIADQVLKAYEHRDKWVNRMILGDSMVVMNSLLQYEGLGGQVQMIYMDPPYGVKFGSNFQPFIRKRDVKHNEDDDMTREPEMVQAYRDTWEVGTHSYLTYMRDRLHMCRNLLSGSGSIFVQISDENVHHVRELMDEVFGQKNFCAEIIFRKTGGQSSTLISSVNDFLLWYARDKSMVKYYQIFNDKTSIGDRPSIYRWVESPDGNTRRKMTADEIDGNTPILPGWRIFAPDTLVSEGATASGAHKVIFAGKTYQPGPTQHWKTTADGMARLAKEKRLIAVSTSLYYVRYLDDFPVTPWDNVWTDTSAGGYSDDKVYVVQTNRKVIQRCLLMTTGPGDLVFDPTCGSGTTAYVAEQWGRRWITVDVSRVPLALARQRLLTATFSWYKLGDDQRGPAAGFVYERRQNSKSEETGGIIPHITLGSIANNEPPGEEVLVDRPEVLSSVTRVTGPFSFEATIPTPVDWEGDGVEDSGTGDRQERGAFVDRMLEVLRKSPVLQLGGGRKATIRNVRMPAKTLSLSAEATVATADLGAPRSLNDMVVHAIEKQGDALPLTDKPVALVFGPENGAVSDKLVYEAAREAHLKNYAHLFVIGFAIQPNARELVEKCEEVVGVGATYVQATPDLMMGDLLKNMRSSQIFSVCGLPEISITKNAEGQYQVDLLGLDVFDPITMEAEHRPGHDVPIWMLDTDYNNMCFHACQAFFPRTNAWEKLKRALKDSYRESVWDHLSGTTSAPFEAGEHGQVAVKVIDDRGNELLVVKNLKDSTK